MLTSVLSPVDVRRPEPMPWNWNPAATFMQAYYDQQVSQRARQDAEMKAELSRILLPQKRAEVEFNLKQLAYESEMLTDKYKLLSEETDARRRILRSGAGSSGSGSTVPGSGNTAQPSRYGGGVADLIKAYQSGGRPPASGGGKTLGSGLTGDE